MTTDLLENSLDQITHSLQSLAGAPASTLIIIGCIILGFVLKRIKIFPNDAIPVVVVLTGAVLYPLIADDRNDLPLRVWIIRNALLGLAHGFAAWLIHNQVLSRIMPKKESGETTVIEKKP